MVPVTTVIIAGTGVNYRMAQRLYGQMVAHGKDVHIMAIPWCGLGPISAATSQLHKEIIGRFGNQPLRLIGHSQGGLIAAGLALSLPEEQVVEVIAIAAPFHGCPLVRLRKLLLWPGPRIIRGLFLDVLTPPALRDMEPGSRYLRDLSERIPEVASLITTVVFVDDWVVPWQSGCLEAPATNHRVGPLEPQRVPDQGPEVNPIASSRRRLGGHILSLLWPDQGVMNIVYPDPDPAAQPLSIPA
ncbi:MAG: Palmitoyl protein thioesterase [Patescibacteria group bacterium]|nr:Palmitoyl protein thioesterase [Patescibacteria group bacterium]